MPHQRGDVLTEPRKVILRIGALTAADRKEIEDRLRLALEL